MQKTVLMWFWWSLFVWSKVIWSAAAFWWRMEKDSAARALSGKVVARRHREMPGGRLSRYKKRKITHFFTLFFRNLQEIKKIKNISFSILLCFMSTI